MNFYLSTKLLYLFQSAINIGVFNKLTATFQESRKFLEKTLGEYIIFCSEVKQLILREKTVLLLCKQSLVRLVEIVLEQDADILGELYPDASQHIKLNN